MILIKKSEIMKLFDDLKNVVCRNLGVVLFVSLFAFMFLCGVYAAVKYWDWEDEPNYKLDKYYENLNRVESDTIMFKKDSIK